MLIKGTSQRLSNKIGNVIQYIPTSILGNNQSRDNNSTSDAMNLLCINQTLQCALSIRPLKWWCHRFKSWLAYGVPSLGLPATLVEEIGLKIVVSRFIQ
jgi:hypothetical protein